MCLGIPGRVTKTWLKESNDLPMARVDFGGVAKEVCLSLLPDVQVDDYVMVHVGFAISQVDEQEAQEIFDLLAQMGELAELEAEEAREISG
jgi:hydrogenase expression/formation protein HypC